MRSNVSLLCPQSRHVTRERSRPPKTLCTHVVSAILASSLLRKPGLKVAWEQMTNGRTEDSLQGMISAARRSRTAEIHEHPPVFLCAYV